MRQGGLTTACSAAAAAIVVALIGSASAEAALPPSVSCRFSETEHLLEVTIRDKRERPKVPAGLPPEVRHEIKEDLGRVPTEPGSAGIERRAEQLTVLRGLQGSPVSCKGPIPTVTNTDSISISLGRHSDSAELLIDFLHGSFAPGFTDEGDGSSEVEISLDIGDGQLYLRGSREPEAVGVTATTGSGATIDIGDAPESSPDVAVAEAVGLTLDTVGGDDSISVAGEPFSFESGGGGLLMIGGQGSDSMAGGSGGEGFAPGPGADSVTARGGRDVVLTGDRGKDRIDCGPGRDRLFAASKKTNGLGCERFRKAPGIALFDFSIGLIIEESEYEEEVAVASVSSVGKILRRSR